MYYVVHVHGGDGPNDAMLSSCETIVSSIDARVSMLTHRLTPATRSFESVCLPSKHSTDLAADNDASACLEHTSA